MLLCKFLIEGYVRGLTVADEDSKGRLLEISRDSLHSDGELFPIFAEVGTIRVRMCSYAALQQPS